MSWTNGYVSDVRYPAFFYKEMQPTWLSTVADFTGVVRPAIERPFTLCELGCGVGINLLVAAACHPQAHFIGVDFNAEHLRVAGDAAASSGLTNVEFIHADFASFARENSRFFDFITCHGTWSWIAPEYRAALMDGVSRSLSPGGLFYLHYMCHPGSTDLLPLQHVLNLCAHHMPGPSLRKAQTGLKLLQQIADTGLFANKPEMLRHLANMAQRDAADLAHEFLTDNWHPQHCVDVHQQAGEAGLTYLASADVFNNLDPALSIPGKMQALVRQARVPALAETLKDLARDAHQRMDLFQKAPVGLGQEGFIAQFRANSFQMLPHAPSRGPVRFSTPIGPVTGPEAVFTPLLQRLAAGPVTGAELLELPVFSGDVGGLLQSLQLLMMQQFIHPCTSATRCDGDRVSKLSRWFECNDIALSIVETCGTATAMTSVPAM